jgi:hypothetical protein
MDTILMARPQADTNTAAMATLIQHRYVDVRMVVSVVCAAFQVIAEHAGSDRADGGGGAGL